jgi:hypothetical protein
MTYRALHAVRRLAGPKISLESIKPGLQGIAFLRNPVLAVECAP